MAHQDTSYSSSLLAHRKGMAPMILFALCDMLTDWNH